MPAGNAWSDTLVLEEADATLLSPRKFSLIVSYLWHTAPLRFQQSMLIERPAFFFRYNPLGSCQRAGNRCLRDANRALSRSCSHYGRTDRCLFCSSVSFSTRCMKQLHVRRKHFALPHLATDCGRLEINRADGALLATSPGPSRRPTKQSCVCGADEFR